MIYIDKRKEPEELQVFNMQRKRRNINWNDKNIPPSLKSVIRKSLCKEQHYRCAYCTREIDVDCQIEHYISRNSNTKLIWDYNNMLAVDNTKSKSQKKYSGTCENGKGSKELHIDPRNKEDMNGIYYSHNGRIKHDKYQDDLDNILHLNDQVYTENRKNLITTLETRLKTTKENGISINIETIRNEYLDENNVAKPLQGIVVWFIDNKKLIY